MIKHSLYLALLLLSLSVVCQGKPLTRRFIVELQQSTGYPNQNFSMRRDLNTSSGNPSDNIRIKGNAGSGPPPDKKRQRACDYEVKKTIIESISWQFRYATNLLIAYELILTTKYSPACTMPHLWLSLDAIVAVNWLLKSCWSPDSPLFNPIEQQATSMLAQGSQPFATMNMMFGTEHHQQPYQSSKSSEQHTPEATRHPKGTVISPLQPGSGGGDEGPQQYFHSLGLNCFVYPCKGICQFRLSFNNTGTAELHCERPFMPIQIPETITGIQISQTEASPEQGLCPHLAQGYCFNCMIESDSSEALLCEQNQLTKILNNFPDDIQLLCDSSQLFQPYDIDGSPLEGLAIDSISTEAACANDPAGRPTCNLTVVGVDGQLRPCGRVYNKVASLTYHKRKAHTAKKTCDVNVVGKDGQSRPCGIICKNASSLSAHKSRIHSGQKTCDATVVGENGQPRPCGKICKNASLLATHKYKIHGRQKSCKMIMVRENGQPHLCRNACKNARILRNHKSREHLGQQICDVTVVGKEDQQQPCGKAYKSIKVLLDHKRRDHTGQKTCDATTFGKDGQRQPCGRVCKSQRSLTDHKRRDHTGQKICQVTVIRENGQLHLCGKICKSAQALSEHKRRNHTGQQICNETVIEENGQQRPCGKTCKNAEALTNHKRIHRKGKPADADKAKGLRLRESQLHK
ncbi:hypothetical protein [Endozoicomonas sp. 8E]|uniref:hypothetical protein n=1 Tax=Endozoicomonas sp. 8E TaxID=3035692 RepID=UPI0029393751|nr:hypothetical protein [Endozoicomonas sp. 8E]WOG27017.1 hypothetical protein P6910_21065 [Endozoicomonas sp. 8E]